MSLRRALSLLIALGTICVYGFSHNHTVSSASFHPTTHTIAARGSESIITEPDEGISPILALIEHASSSVDLVMYQLEDTAIERALADDTARGVSVRVLLNEGYYGKKENTKNDEAYQYLSDHNVSVHWTPSYFALTHQKTIIIDRNTAAIMTMNLTPQYYASGREFVILDNNTNDVAAVEQTFESDWKSDHATANNGDNLVWSPGSEETTLNIINNAQKSLDIYNEEMADTKVTQALIDAAKRGVVVRLTMTYSTNWKSAFTTLAAAGVSVHTYAKSAPLYIHAKVIISDDTQAFVGSENFSSNSLNKNRELGLIVTDPATLVSLQTTFEKDYAGAREFTR